MVNCVYRNPADKGICCTEVALDDLEWTRIHK